MAAAYGGHQKPTRRSRAAPQLQPGHLYFGLFYRFKFPVSLCLGGEKKWFSCLKKFFQFENWQTLQFPGPCIQLRNQGNTGPRTASSCLPPPASKPSTTPTLSTGQGFCKRPASGQKRRAEKELEKWLSLPSPSTTWTTPHGRF